MGNIIYFEYDSSELRPEDTDIVASHARQLSMNSSLSVRLEGHADERGSREYNIGLGERRAQTVRRLLLIQGASASQVSTVSFGEERPAVEGSSEAAYAQNRRVEITYTN
jgi:peptidoglycan-associated lipoprotein